MPGSDTFRTETHEVDFCVVGGGMAGYCAALAAARHGVKTVLIHDRPMLGGNASSECRVHIGGADVHNHNKNMRETGILEELRMKNLSCNPVKSYSVWDTVLYETLRYQSNLHLLLNCSCLDATMDGDLILTVKGWQLTTQTYHVVKARIFADCSGDGILAPLTGAAFRMGREARGEYGESIAPEKADNRTMGMTCLFQARQHDSVQPFVPPAWAERYDSCEELPYGTREHGWWEMGYWWVELGGEHDAIHDAEFLRDELLKITYGVWDHLKNRCPNRKAVENWAIDWIQFLPAKRESRRFIGDHVLTQNDVEAEGRFDDLVAYGGWSMDDHHPSGFRAVRIGAPATIFHKAPSPYGIPYRALYSRNISNLMFAGRDASCTHSAMSSTRVMGTGCSMGQAVGTAAAIAIREKTTPRGVGSHIRELQQTLINDDCYLPWIRQELPELTTSARLAASAGDPEPLRDGINRPVGADTHCWTCSPGDHAEYLFLKPEQVTQVSLIFNSALDRNPILSHHQKDDQLTSVPDVMTRTFRLEGLSSGGWSVLTQVDGNFHRLVRVNIGRKLEGIRFVLEKTWGAASTRLYAFYCR